MATVTKFEDLEVWKLSRYIVNEVYKITRNDDFKSDFVLTDQIRRSAIGILSTIAEGFESGSDAQFARYLKIAKASAGECRAQLYIVFDQNYINEKEFSSIKKELIRSSKKLSRLISYLSDKANYTKDIEIIYEV